MTALGFVAILSPEDTGPKDDIHTIRTTTEWWIAFYNPDTVTEATDLPSGFLADDRSNHPDYVRVPYAFAFRTVNAKLDFVLISVHLQRDEGDDERERRRHELESIAQRMGSTPVVDVLVAWHNGPCSGTERQSGAAMGKRNPAKSKEKQGRGVAWPPRRS